MEIFEINQKKGTWMLRGLIAGWTLAVSRHSSPAQRLLGRNSEKLLLKLVVGVCLALPLNVFAQDPSIPTLPGVTAYGKRIGYHQYLSAPTPSVPLDVSTFGSEENPVCAALRDANVQNQCSFLEGGDAAQLSWDDPNWYQAGTGLYRVIDWFSNPSANAQAVLQLKGAIVNYEEGIRFGYPASALHPTFIEGVATAVITQASVPNDLVAFEELFVAYKVLLGETVGFQTVQERNNFVDRFVASLTGLRPDYGFSLGYGVFAVDLYSPSNSLKKHLGFVQREKLCDDWRQSMKENQCGMV